MVNRQSDTGNGECLTEDLLSGYLEGTLTPVVKAACEVHLISCDDCRQKLADFMRVLQPDITEQEMVAVNTAVVRWEQRELRPIPIQPARPSRRSVYYAFAAIAAVLIVGVIVQVSFLSTPVGEEIVQEILAGGRGRPFQAQVADQSYREYFVTRSPETAQQLEATEDVMKRARAYEKGRVYLVNREYDNAIRELETARQDPNVSSKVLNDLGVAYFQRDRDHQDLESAKGLFLKALELDNKFLPAMFNLGLLYERQEKAEDAQRTWKQYQNLDSESGWAEEIRVKLEEDSKDK